MVLLLLKVGVVVWRRHGVGSNKTSIVTQYKNKRKGKERKASRNQEAVWRNAREKNGRKIYGENRTVVFGREEAGDGSDELDKGGQGWN